MSKVVLITGGSSGIGKSIGEFLKTKGFIVYGTSRNPEKYTNSEFPLVALDVTKIETIATCINQVLEKEDKIDVLVNNAGPQILDPGPHTLIIEFTTGDAAYHVDAYYEIEAKLIAP